MLHWWIKPKIQHFNNLCLRFWQFGFNTFINFKSIEKNWSIGKFVVLCTILTNYWPINICHMFSVWACGLMLTSLFLNMLKGHAKHVFTKCGAYEELDGILLVIQPSWWLMLLLVVVWITATLSSEAYLISIRESSRVFRIL